MKYLIKTSLYLLSCTFLFISCGDSSTIGAWSSTDMSKCKSEIKVGMYEEGEDEAEEIFASFGTNADKISACMCEELEQEYSSFKEADNDPEMENMNEKEGVERLMSCLYTNDESMINIFMTNCAEDTALKQYCSCLLEELMERYTWAEIILLTEDDYANLETFEDCIELVD